ncbi:hypothetical protein [Bacillus toyonensis]|uniref:hypothetical protein n=1 Tax=Bacillus toyonensis TaxID=155322 RepID=UPI003D6506A8
MSVFVTDNVCVDMFTVLTEFDKIANELERAAEKFRTAYAGYKDEITNTVTSSEKGRDTINTSSSKKDGESLEKVT